MSTASEFTAVERRTTATQPIQRKFYTRKFPIICFALIVASFSRNRQILLEAKRRFYEDKNESSVHLRDREKIVSYTLLQQPPPPSIFDSKYSCYARLPAHGEYNKSSAPRIQKRGRRDIPKWLADRLRFTTAITLQNIKVLVMGDSVGMQFSQALQEAAGARAANKWVYRALGPGRDSLHVVAPLFRDRFVNVNLSHPSTLSGQAVAHDLNGTGNSAVAGFRITDFFRRENENKPLPNSRGGGWVRSDVSTLLNHTYQFTPVSGNATTSQTTIGSFDALIFRIPTPYISLETVLEEKMAETVILAQELFGVNVVVFIGIPFDNGILKNEDYDLLKEKNNLLKKFVSNSRKYSNITATVLFSDFGNFADELIKANAGTMEMDMENPYFMVEENLGYNAAKNFQMSIPLVCGDRSTGSPGNLQCVKNMLSSDGLHWCVETIGGRFSANIACLLACAYNRPDSDRDENNLRACEQKCNDQFMSLTSIPDWMFNRALF